MAHSEVVRIGDADREYRVRWCDTNAIEGGGTLVRHIQFVFPEKINTATQQQHLYLSSASQFPGSPFDGFCWSFDAIVNLVYSVDIPLFPPAAIPTGLNNQLVQPNDLKSWLPLWRVFGKYFRTPVNHPCWLWPLRKPSCLPGPDRLPLRIPVANTATTARAVFPLRADRADRADLGTGEYSPRPLTTRRADSACVLQQPPGTREEATSVRSWTEHQLRQPPGPAVGFR